MPTFFDVLVTAVSIPQITRGLYDPLNGRELLGEVWGVIREGWRGGGGYLREL